jgi:capsular polysaccharide biosynthesis protein
MTDDHDSTEVGNMREIDFGRWFDAFRSRWWIAVAGLLVGALGGAVHALNRTSTFTATAFVAPGQAFNPNGTSAVLSYLTSPAAIQKLATSLPTLQEAAARAGASVEQLRGNVWTSAVNQTITTPGSSSAAPGRTVLVAINVQLGEKRKAEDAANAVAEIIQRKTTSDYVSKFLGTFDARIRNLNQRDVTLAKRVAMLQQALARPTLSLDDRLLLSVQLDQAQTEQSTTFDSLSTTRQQQLLAANVEQTQIIQPAKAEKAMPPSKRSSIVVGSVLGFLIGAMIATAVGLRRTRPARA